MGLNLAVLLDDAGRRHPDRPAVKLGDLTLNYALLDGAARRVAGGLREAGIEPGDRVALMVPNVPQFPILYYGALRAGATVVPLNVLLKEREVAYYLSDSGASVLFAWEGFLEQARAGAREAGVERVWAVTMPDSSGGDLPTFNDLLASEPFEDTVQRDPDDAAVLLYTSGTEGAPKGATLTHSTMLWNAEVSATTVIELTPEDVIFGGLPLFHSFGQTAAMNTAIRSGACLALLPRFEPEAALDLLEGAACTVFEGVPTMFNALLNAESAQRRDLSKLRLCVSGGASIAVEVLRGFEQTFGCQVLEGYGLSETSPVASFNHPDRPSKPGSIGTPIWGVEMRVVGDDGAPRPPGEIGEIVIRGHNVMKGYWNRPDDTAQAIDERGWLRTGDMARVDEDGFFFIVDRKKDLIIRGGYNIYPREVEEILYEHPATLEAAVIGIPHAELGEEVCAIVVLKSGESVEPAELQAYVKERIAAYKYPRQVLIADALPKGPTGKILKREIDVRALSGA
jgi:long-chain acyl-CoA synthetase